MLSPHILVIGSESETLHAVNAVLANNLSRLAEAATEAEGLARVQLEPAPDLVLLEVSSGNGRALQTLQQLRALRPGLAIVVLSALGNNRRVVDAIRLGAHDYLNMPLQEIELQEVLVRYIGPQTCVGTTNTDPAIEELGNGEFFLAASSVMRKVRVQADVLADIDVPVLILGESGTGKKVTAHLIHKLSPQSQRRFLKVNCAALPGELLKSELFGYEGGTFPGAMRRKQGKFERCENGTILLDEVAEMSGDIQAKLLHVFQDQDFFRLRGENKIGVNVRILSATTANVHQLIVERRFREDLYCRLSAFTIMLPPLRERQEEIPLLLRHFMGRIAAQYSRPPLQFSPVLIEACLRYSWPGNLRELHNFVNRYLVMADEAMAIAELRAHGQHRRAVETSSGPTAPHFESVSSNGKARGIRGKSSLRTLKDETEVHAIMRALEETRWNRKRATRLLGISYRGLLYKIRQHGITQNEEDHDAVAPRSQESLTKAFSGRRRI
jgi:two-component system response regulator AtoC